MNALAAERALVLDELEAELIHTQHIQDVLYFETDARQIVARSVDSRVIRRSHVSSWVFIEMMNLQKAIECHSLVPQTLS